MDNSIGKLLDDVEKELNRAAEKFHPFNSTHEGYAVMLEEVNELWDAVRCFKACTKDSLDVEQKLALRKECIQIAAMATRFVRDLC